MTVEETKRLSPDEILALDQEQINQLPTILDVLEYLSYLENEEMQKTYGNVGSVFNLNKEGYYEWVSDKEWTNQAKLMPLSQTPFLFMRGQNEFFKQCLPSIWRSAKSMTSDEFQTISRIKTAEFILAYETHPIIQELRSNCVVEDIAIAQHYGFPTEYLDITNNKWVAAFFATTCFKDKKYHPVATGFGRGYGIMYITKKDVNLYAPELRGNLQTLGFQYFKRPSQQNTWLYRMDSGDDFENNQSFDRIVFRHDTDASKLVFEYSFCQKRYFPKDPIAELAEYIQRPDYLVSKMSIKKSHSLGVSKSDEEICEVLRKFHIGVTDAMQPLAQIPADTIKAEWNEWISYGRANLQRHIMPIIPIYPLSSSV